MATIGWRSPVTTRSTDLEALVEGGTYSTDLGSLVRAEPDGRKYRLFKSSGVIATLVAAEGNGIDSTTGIPEVITYTTATIKAACFNNGAATAAGEYFWGLVAGTITMTEGADTTPGGRFELNVSGLPIDLNTNIDHGWILADLGSTCTVMVQGLL